MRECGENIIRSNTTSLAIGVLINVMSFVVNGIIKTLRIDFCIIATCTFYEGGKKYNI